MFARSKDSSQFVFADPAGYCRLSVCPPTWIEFSSFARIGPIRRRISTSGGFSSAELRSKRKLPPLSTTSIDSPASVTWMMTWSFSGPSVGSSATARWTAASSAFACASSASCSASAATRPSSSSCCELPCTTMMSLATICGSRLLCSFTSSESTAAPGMIPGARKYCAICCRSLRSACVSSQRTMNSAIMAVTKSA